MYTIVRLARSRYHCACFVRELQPRWCEKIRSNRRGTSKVVFGPPNVTPLLGALTLESLGLMVNPVTREVLPMRLFLAASRSPRQPLIPEPPGKSYFSFKRGSSLETQVALFEIA
jgi:hypothetical protein